MNVIYVIGAGGHGKVVADTARAAGYAEVFFVDQSWPEITQNGRFAVVGNTIPPEAESVFCAVGNNRLREELFDRFHLSDSPVLVHPSAVVSPSVRIGAGTLVVAGGIVNADAEIGRGVILNTGSSVDHDCVLGDFVHISPGARLAGGVSIGPRSWIGIGAVVREGVTIGADVVVAAGAAVINDIGDGEKVGGVPARRI